MTVLRPSRTHHAASTEPVVVGIDGSASSVDALREAVEIARSRHVRLEAITAWGDTAPAGNAALGRALSTEAGARAVVASAMRTVFAGPPPEWFHSSVERGSAAWVLRTASAEAQMLIVGGGDPGSRAMLGTVAATCATFAECPVLIVHHAGRSRAGA